MTFNSIDTFYLTVTRQEIMGKRGDLTCSKGSHTSFVSHPGHPSKNVLDTPLPPRYQKCTKSRLSAVIVGESENSADTRFKPRVGSVPLGEKGETKRRQAVLWLREHVCIDP